MSESSASGAKEPHKPVTIHRQLLIAVIGVNMLVMLLTSVVLYVEQKRSLLSGIDAKLTAVATYAREILPPDYHDRLTGADSVSESDYRRIVERNDRLCSELGLKYIWSLMNVDGKLVFTTTTSPDKTIRNGQPAKFFEPHSNPELYADAFATMKPTYKSNHDKWGDVRVTLLPFLDGHGRKCVFGACVQLTEVDWQLRNIVWKSLAVGLAVFIFSMIVGFMVAQLVITPLHRLTETILAIASGDSGLKADEHGTYEQVTLAHTINNLNRILQEKITELETSKARLIDQRNAERKQAQEDMMLSEQRYHALLNFAVDGILIGTNDGVITDANEYICALFGLRPEEVIGKHLREMPFEPESVSTQPFRFDLVHKGEIVVRERTILRRDGSRVTVELRTKMMSDGTLQSIYRDVTERKKAQEVLVSWNAELERRVVERTEEVGKYARQLQALTGRLIRAEDDECQRISNVLHEDLQQVLVAARMTLVSVSESVQNVSSKAMIDHVGDMLTQALQLTRSLVQEIAVPAVHEGDLRYVVNCIAQRMQEKFGLQVTLTGDETGLESVGQSVYICLYRVIQELLFNVVKHAGVKQAGIEIRRLGDHSIKIEISDKGCGFSADGLAESIRKGKCFGLLSIRERIEGLGGQLNVISAVGQGTTVILTLPPEGV